MLAMACVLFGFTGCGKSVEKQILEQLELGQKYLEELDYEEAIVAFSAVIRLEDKNLDAYRGLAEAYQKTGRYQEAADTLEQGYAIVREQQGLAEEWKEQLLGVYVEWVDDYMNQGEWDKALGVVERGLAEEPQNEALKERQEEILKKQEEMKLLLTYGEFLERMYQAAETDDIEELKAIQLDALYQQFCENLEEPYDYPEEGARAIRIYPSGYLYWGDVADGKREGHGIWLRNTTSDIVLFEGRWQDDYPNGEGEYYREYHGTGEGTEKGLLRRGGYLDGWEHGEMMMETVHWNGEITVCHYRADHGHPVKIADYERDESRYIFAYDDNDPDSSFIASAKTTFGVTEAKKEDE